MAKKLRASSEVTIVDISDSKQLALYIGSTLQRQVVYDPNSNTYTPNYGTVNNVLTPQVYIAGSTQDISADAKSIKWFVQKNSTGAQVPITANTTDYILSTSKPTSLTIKNNVLKDNLSMNYIVEVIYTDPDTGMDIIAKAQMELVKITNGIQGVRGDNAIIGVLTNESHNIPTDSEGNNGNFTGANSKIQIFDGISDATSLWSITAKASTGVTGSFASNTYTVTGLSTDTGYVDFTATKSGYATINKRFTISKVKAGHMGVDGKTPIKGTDYFDGENGQDGKSSFLWVMYSQNADGSGMTVNPEKAVYIGLATTETNVKPTDYKKYTWALIKGENGIAGEQGEDGQTSYLHIKYSNDGKTFTTNNGETAGDYIGTYVDFTEADSLVFSDYTWSKIKGENGVDGKTPVKGADYFDGRDGQDGESSYLWIMYSQNADGSGMTIEPSNAKYIGVATTKTNNKPANNNSYTWTLIKGSNGVAGEAGADGKTSYLHVKYSPDGKVFTANNGETVGAYIGTYVDFTEADSTTFSKYTWSKIKGDDGVNGADGIVYKLISDVSAVKRASSGVYEPTAINLRATSQTGTSAVKAYNAKFIISEQVTTAWAVKYTSASGESSKSYTLTGTDVKAFKVQMYSTDGLTLMDEQIIPVVFDGTDPITTLIDMLDGNTIKNSEGTLRLKANTYKGNDLIVGSKYAWWERDPSATATSGWRQLTSANPDGTTGYTTDTLVVSGSSIDSMSTFKVEVTRDGKIYSDQATVHDLIDPIQTEIIGTGTFKNGIGQNSFTAVLYQNGMEIDTKAPYKYTYTWNMYKADGTLDSAFKATGKKITVQATQFLGTANMVCVVSTP